MTFYHAAVTHSAHICPADPQLHAWMTERVVLGIIDGGPCLTPKTLQLGDTKNVVACGRRKTADKQCAACRITIIETAVTTHITPEVVRNR